VPEHRNQLDDLTALLESDATWPVPTVHHSPSGLRILDVDRIGDLASVVTIESEDSPFQPGLVDGVDCLVLRFDGRTWEILGGAGGGNDSDPLTVRDDPDTWHHPPASLISRMAESHGRSIEVEHLWLGVDGLKLGCLGLFQSVFKCVAVLCAPQVQTVEVERNGEVRVVDVSSGPGWFGVTWHWDVIPILKAYDASGRPAVLANLNM
jgi:hypothetical protein